MRHQLPAPSWRARLARAFSSTRKLASKGRNVWLAGFWVAAILGAIVLSVIPPGWIPLIPDDLTPDAEQALDLSLHFIGYAGLVGFASLLFDRVAPLLVIYIAALGIGALLEAAQSFVPGRGAALDDLSMNILGASAGFLFGLVRLRRSSRVLLGSESRQASAPRQRGVPSS